MFILKILNPHNNFLNYKIIKIILIDINKNKLLKVGVKLL